MEKLKATELKQCVLAFMKGDGYTEVNYTSGKARLDIYHCEAQLAYINWKCEVLNQITGVTCTVKEKVDKRPLVGGNTRKGYRLQTNFSRYLFNLHQTPEKFKVKQLVKPRALAILWQDDGTLCIDSSGYFSTATLCTDSWDWDFIGMFNKYFNGNYGWCMRELKYKCRGKEYPRLRMRKDEMIKLGGIIACHLQPCMEYKLL